jgi:VanZ family protein
VKTLIKNLFYYWLPVLVWATFIFFLSSRPGLKIATGTLDFLTRKPAHILEYFILTLLIIRASTFGLFKKSDTSFVLGFSFLLSLFYAGLDEVHQTFVPLREGKISDILFDSVGSLFAIFLGWKLFLTRQNKPKK